MRKIIVCSLVIILGVILILFSSTAQQNTQYLRIHIRANSNLTIDQAVKYKVKDAVVDYMIPILADCQSIEQSKSAVGKNLSAIENIAEGVLKQNGFTYSASAHIANEKFPTRSYGELTLESGFYDALILNLGSGNGDNWWCVVYPPLCFVNGGTHANTFKSRILEIINSVL